MVNYVEPVITNWRKYANNTKGNQEVDDNLLIAGGFRSGERTEGEAALEMETGQCGDGSVSPSDTCPALPVPVLYLVGHGKFEEVGVQLFPGDLVRIVPGEDIAEELSGPAELSPPGPRGAVYRDVQQLQAQV